MGSELAFWLQSSVLAANWQSAANWRLGCKRAANWRSGCKLAFRLQTGNRQRTGVLAANLQRIGVWAANRQRTGVLAANWRFGCKLAIGSELAFAAQTPICCRLLICSPNANLHTYCIFAAQTHYSCPNVCIPEVQLRKDRRACCQGSMRCAPRKSPKGLLVGTQSSCDLANTAGPAVGEACDARAQKDRKAG